MSSPKAVRYISSQIPLINSFALKPFFLIVTLLTFVDGSLNIWAFLLFNFFSLGMTLLLVRFLNHLLAIVSLNLTATVSFILSATISIILSATSFILSATSFILIAINLTFVVRSLNRWDDQEFIFVSVGLNILLIVNFHFINLSVLLLSSELFLKLFLI